MSDAPADTDTPSNEALDDAPEAPEPGSEPSDTPEAADEPADASDAREAFESFFSTRTSSSWTVTYEMSSNAPGAEMMEGLEMTQYIDGTDRFRTDTAMDGMESRSYFVEGVVTVCTRQDEWMCFESDLSDEIATQADVETAVEAGDYTVRATEGRVIAGARTSCFVIDTGDAEAEYCFSDEGVPLSMVITAEDMTMELIATEYSVGVSADAWDLPAEPGSFPGMGGFDPSAYI